MDLIEGVKQAILSKHPRIDRKNLRLKMLDYIENGAFEPMIAIAIITAASITLNKPLTGDQIFEKAKNMNLELPLSVGFYRWICYKIVHDSINMQSKTSKVKRWNWMWDYHVSFPISDNTLNNREITLITSDADIITLLKDFGYTNRVMQLSDYLNYIDN
jgi:hypothetical protein